VNVGAYRYRSDLYLSCFLLYGLSYDYHHARRQPQKGPFGDRVFHHVAYGLRTSTRRSSG
jgi:hypothetical protein